jgi:predicted nucleotidyltransferase component of viral defense system
MAKEVTNRAASIKQRLLTLARTEGRVYDVILVRYALERLLYRLSISAHRERFILKGGMLVTLWLDSETRETRDADFLGHGDANPDALKAVFATILAVNADDGLVFNIGSLTARPIREDMEYEGVRLSTTALLERTRIPVTIDVGFGDAVAPAAQAIAYPSMLDMEMPQIRTYPPAMVIAEKFQAIVALGVINGRMKDYFDLWAIPRAMVIAAPDLDAAIQATFERRRTAIPKARPPGLSDAMLRDGTRQTQWRAYSEQVNLTGVTLGDVIEAVWQLVGPSCARLTGS